jgi:hypothetical protein
MSGIWIAAIEIGVSGRSVVAASGFGSGEWSWLA